MLMMDNTSVEALRKGRDRALGACGTEGGPRRHAVGASSASVLRLPQQTECCFAHELSFRRERRRLPDATQQGVARFPLCGRVESFKKLHLACCQRGDWQAIAIEHAVAGQRR